MRNAVLFALALALLPLAYAGATPPQGRSITVDATASGCKYTGGDNSDGDVTFQGRGRTSVTLHAAGSYTIAAEITSDPNNQLTIRSSSPTTNVIQDENDVAQEATYKVTLKDANGGATACDPKIINN